MLTQTEASFQLFGGKKCQRNTVSPPDSQEAKADNVSCLLQNKPGWGVGEQYTITEWTHPCAPGGPPNPILGSPCQLPGKDVSQCQRLVKRKGIFYLKSYTNIRVIT